MFQVVKHFFLAFIEETVQLTLRGPFIIVALSPLIAQTSAWQVFASSWSASDVRSAAAWSDATARLPTMAVVAIDEPGYQHFFDAKSPLDRDRVAALLRTIDQHSPNAKRITIDLDLSPVPGQAAGQARLDQLFLENPKRWVLAAVDAGDEADIKALQQWRVDHCARGVSFGLPYVPTEFGYPKLTHQYEDGLADMTLQAAGTCADPTEPRVQKEMALSPTVLKAGLVIPFSGDLEQLGQVLDYVDAEWIFVGGNWGRYDIFGTPFGERFGIMVHFAALAGSLSHERQASYLVSLGSSFLFLSLCTIILKYMNTLFDRWLHPPTPRMVGHQFYLERLQPVQFVLTVFALLYLASECLSLLRAETGYWIPSAIVGSTALGSILLTWNWGQNKVADYHSLSHLFRVMVIGPIKLELKSIASSLAVIWHGPSRSTWGETTDQQPIGRGRAALEGFFALLSVAMQTLLPVGTISYAAYQALTEN